MVTLLSLVKCPHFLTQCVKETVPQVALMHAFGKLLMCTVNSLIASNDENDLFLFFRDLLWDEVF